MKHASSLLSAGLLSLLAAPVFAQPIKRLHPIGPNREQNISGPMYAREYQPGAPRRIAQAGFITRTEEGEKVMDSSICIYSKASHHAPEARISINHFGKDDNRSLTTYVIDSKTGFAIAAHTQRQLEHAGELRNERRASFFNNSRGVTTEAHYEAWDTALGAYRPDSRQQDILNDAGYLIERRQSSWIPDQAVWIERQHYIFTRNAQHNIIREESAQRYNAKDDAARSRTEYDYDASGRVLKGYRSFKWDVQKGVWKERARTVLLHDASSRPVSGVTETYHEGIQQWEKSVRTTYVYDAAGNLIAEEIERYSEIGRKFVKSQRNSWSYNSFNQLTASESGSYWHDGAWTKPMLGTRYHYER